MTQELWDLLEKTLSLSSAWSPHLQREKIILFLEEGC